MPNPGAGDGDVTLRRVPLHREASRQQKMERDLDSQSSSRSWKPTTGNSESPMGAKVGRDLKSRTSISASEQEATVLTSVFSSKHPVARSKCLAGYGDRSGLLVMRCQQCFQQFPLAGPEVVQQRRPGDVECLGHFFGAAAPR